MRFKQLFTSFLAGACAFSLCACGNTETAPPTQNEYTKIQDSICETYNNALQKLSEADSYTMIGSVASVSDIASSDVMTTVHTVLECRYQDGKAVYEYTNTNDPHKTYFDGERYYYELSVLDTDMKYFVTANDHNDYSALDYLMSVDAEILLNPNLLTNEDGSCSLGFEIPFAIYESPALYGWLGYIIDESHAANFLRITAEIDKDGYFTYFSLSFLNDTNVGENIHQELAVNMTLSGYNTTVITPPSDLSAYEDWSEDIPESTTPMLPLTPEDLE